MKVGQIWRDRTGTRTTITSVTGSGNPGYPVSGRDEAGPTYSFTLDGAFSRGLKSCWDLVTLEQDVPDAPAACGACRGEGGFVEQDYDTRQQTGIMCDECQGSGIAPKLYIAGPMTGIPALNFPAFHAAAAHYRAQGFDVINPADINGEDPNPEWVPGSPELAAHWAKCMRADITALLTCDKIVMLDGWTASRGATLEHHIAVTLGVEVLNHGV
jgi:Domain of unknown function (DUF4406)